MTNRLKTNIALLFFGSIVLLLIVFAVSPTISQIKKESEDFVMQKKELNAFEAKIKNIQDFRVNFKQYQSDLERIDDLFVNTTEPIEFIEFLEQEAASFGLLIEIIPSAGSEFILNLRGSSPNFSRFLERLEYGPYLVTPVNLNVRKIADENNIVSAVLLIKIFTK